MSPSEDKIPAPTLLQHTTAIVCAFVGHNALPVDALPGVIARTYEALENISLPQQKAEETPLAPAPAVPVKKSVHDDYLICLEDGRKFKSLKRHLRSQYNMSGEDYRAKWGLGSDYPLVAPAYARARSALAKSMGLGTLRKQQLAAEKAPPVTKAATRKSAKVAA